MFNPERLLGGLLRSGMRRNSGLGGLAAGGAALGLLGVAMEAFEHYANKGTTVPPATGLPPVPPAQPGSTNVGRVAAPPPPPGASVGTAPPPFAGPAESPLADAVLLIRAMIAAANADGVIDDGERIGILGKLRELNLSREEQQFIIGELLAPKSRQDIVAAVASPQTARRVYLVSLLAVEVDTDAEKRYLKDLAKELGLDDVAVTEIHRQVGLPLF